MDKTYIELSRREYWAPSDSNNIKRDDINAGSLQRIAMALEGIKTQLANMNDPTFKEKQERIKAKDAYDGQSVKWAMETSKRFMSQMPTDINRNEKVAWSRVCGWVAIYNTLGENMLPKSEYEKITLEDWKAMIIEGKVSVRGVGTMTVRRFLETSAHIVVKPS